jgi:hypothetical protein
MKVTDTLVNLSTTPLVRMMNLAQLPENFRDCFDISVLRNTKRLEDIWLVIGMCQKKKGISMKEVCRLRKDVILRTR